MNKVEMRAALAPRCLKTSSYVCRDRATYSLKAVSLYSTSCRRTRNNRPFLESPSILFSDNHLLVVNKPAGWHTVPNPTGSQSKCLLNYLQKKKLGGGATRTFLKPLHRIDQPCTGVLLLGKTSKAASRIQTQWSKIQKTYICVLDSSMNRSASDGWMQLEGYLQRQRTKHSNDSHREGGWSVRMLPYKKDTEVGLRRCSLEWKIISPVSIPFVILQVRTHQGARHMIRALLSQCGSSSIAGDLRYQASQALPDQSVALHARRLQLPETLQLGSLAQRHFIAPLPSTWNDNFGVTEEMIQEWEVQ